MSETVFNEGSVDVDFRIEGSTATHALFVEGETDRVGIGTNDPAAILDVQGSTGSNYVGSFTNASATGWGLFVKGGADNADYSLRVQDKDAGDLLSVKSGGNIGIGTNDPGYQLDLRRNDTGTTTSLGIRQIGTGDASMAFQTTTSPYGFCIGVDGSDSDAFKIATGTDDVGTNTKLSIDNSGDVTISELLYVNNAVNHDRTTAGSTFRAANNGNAAITLLSSANHSAGVGTAIVALNFAANNEWSTTKDGVYAQIRCENGDGTYADRGQLVFATGYNGNTINDRMTIQSDGGVVMSAGKISMATQSGTGLAKIHGETTNKITLADDATTTLSSTPVMMILIYVHSGSYVGAGGIWGATYKGGTGLIYDDGNCANADTDGKLCCYKTTNSHTTTIKNRLGAEATFTIMSYSS